MGHRLTNIAPVLTDNESILDMGPTAGPLSLKQYGELERQKLLRFNEYKDSTGHRYDTTHPNANSDGDEHGRGDNGSNMVGTSLDKATKTRLLYSSGNKYHPGKGYNNLNYNEDYF